MFKVRTAVTGLLLCAAAQSGWAQGGVFVTGHDPDYHAIAGNTIGAQHIIQRAINFVTNGSIGNILLVTDTNNPGGDEIDSRLGMAAAGFTFDVADDGTAGGSVLDVHTVNFAAYSAVVIASDYGGWLRESELEALDARSTDIINYVNGGGGLVAFSESGSNLPTDPAKRFKFLPFLVSADPLGEFESSNTLTPFGLSLGLTDSDINGNFSHSAFTSTGGLNVVDTDPAGDILSLGFRGKITSGGVVPEPGTVALALGLLTTGSLLRRRRRA